MEEERVRSVIIDLQQSLLDDGLSGEDLLVLQKQKKEEEGKKEAAPHSMTILKVLDGIRKGQSAIIDLQPSLLDDGLSGRTCLFSRNKRKSGRKRTRQEKEGHGRKEKNKKRTEKKLTKRQLLRRH
ncbi:hypothetical protein CEXT_709591 [Caerostris extrusa]|uniref:Uncharacterized protein n=1 Tax=Caerostris extrusa TaxID=172846 RepID=A0AAV4UAF3_CAEEX|nr:hypothetical protein CEXT_709591 [Caerostris extrusa]